MECQIEDTDSMHYDVASAFYNAILSRAIDTTEDFSSSESIIYDTISNMLDESDKLSQFIPALPQQLIEFLEEINQENTDFDKICDIISGDIALAGETVRLANSPLYRRSSGEIDSIERAIACLGLQGVAEIASVLLIRQILDVDTNRFKVFGKVLWKHSLECAEACRLLSNDNIDPFTGYFMGLIHDVGKVAIYTCICKYLDVQNSQNIDIDEGKLFKLVLGENSTWLSAQIASQWNLPPAITLALSEFDSLTITYSDNDQNDQSALGSLLVKANTCSEIYTLMETGIVSNKDGVKLLRDLGLDKNSINRILDRYKLLHIGADLKH